MITKINDNAYFIVDVTGFSNSINQYDDVLANQTISNQDIEIDCSILSHELNEDIDCQNESRAFILRQIHRK